MDTNYELYENAKKRIRQRKRLYYHFVVFIIGIIFIYILNKFFHVGEDTLSNWSYYAIGIWFFLWCLHFANVHIFQRFMNKEWELRETERLIKKQENKIAQLSLKVKKQFEDKKKALENELKIPKSDSNTES